MILNLTPHPIRLYDAERVDGLDDLTPHLREVIPPEDTPARLSMYEIGLDGDGVERVAYENVTDLPVPRAGVRFVVSLVIGIAMANQRDDLIVPYREVRNSAGTVIGCRAFARPY